MVRELGSETFESLVCSGRVLVDFYSPTCGPCKMLSFVLGDVSRDVGDDLLILKVNFDENQDLVEANEIKGYPTLIYFENGAEVRRMTGLHQKPEIVRFVEPRE